MTQFEQDAAGNTVLSACWSVVGKDGAVMAMRRSSYKSAGAPADAAGTGNSGSGRPYDAIAAAMSRDLESLSRDIAAAITGLKAS